MEHGEEHRKAPESKGVVGNGPVGGGEGMPEGIWSRVAGLRKHGRRVVTVLFGGGGGGKNNIHTDTIHQS